MYETLSHSKESLATLASLGSIAEASGGIAEAGPQIRQVLHATDFSAASQAAFQFAVTTCRSLGAVLTLLHIYEPPVVGLPERGEPGEDFELVQLALKQQLRDLMHRAEHEGVECRLEMRAGRAAQGILDVIGAGGVDLAVLGTRAQRGISRFYFGSTAEGVLRQSACPVMTIGPYAAAALKGEPAAGPIVFATDFDEATLPAVRYAYRFREVTELPLYCLHVLPRSLELMPSVGSLQQVLNDGLAHLAKEGGRNEPTPVCVTSYSSDVCHAIVEYAKEVRARLVVLGVRQSSLLKAHLPPHVAYRVIVEAACPVLTMAYDEREERELR